VTTTPEESPRQDTDTPRSSSGELAPSTDDAESAVAAAASTAAQGQPAPRAPSPAAAAAALATLASSASVARLDSPRDAAALVSTTPAAEHNKQKVSFEPGVTAAAGGAAPAPAQAELTGASVPGSATRQLFPGRERPTSSSGGYRGPPGSHNGHAGARTGVAQGAGGLKYSSNSNKLEVRVSAGGSDSSSDSGRTCCGCSRKVLWCALTVLLLVVMAGVGVGVGVSFAKGKKGTGAAKSAAAAVKAMPAMSVYGLMAHPGLPGATSDQRCRLWFGSEEVRCSWNTTMDWVHVRQDAFCAWGYDCTAGQCGLLSHSWLSGACNVPCSAT